MSSIEQRGLSAGAVDLAAIIHQSIMGGEDADRAFGYAEGVAPAIVLARAAMAITGAEDTSTAVELLFEDPEKQQAIRDALADPALKEALGLPEATHTARAQELRSAATKAGALDITALRRGEKVTLVYEGLRRWLGEAVLVGSRHVDGSDNDCLSLLIHETGGATIRASWHTIRPRQAVYLGYRYGTHHGSRLQRDAHPAWVTSIRKPTKQEQKSGATGWLYGDLYEDRRFALRQAFYGTGFDCPLFAD